VKNENQTFLEFEIVKNEKCLGIVIGFSKGFGIAVCLVWFAFSAGITIYKK
jgi:hypothetical protein